MIKLLALMVAALVGVPAIALASDPADLPALLALLAGVGAAPEAAGILGKFLVGFVRRNWPASLGALKGWKVYPVTGVIAAGLLIVQAKIFGKYAFDLTSLAAWAAIGRAFAAALVFNELKKHGWDLKATPDN